METKVLQVFYGKDCLPYKDKERSVHFPIVGAAIQGASNTTKIRFYFDELVEEDDQTTTWVVVSKLPNGKIGSEIVETALDSELNEHYALFNLKNFYTQAKGDLFLSLQGYQGGVQVETDPDTGISQIIGTPTIQATGSIKLAINYATQLVGSGETANINFQKILADLGTKLGIRAYTERVTELPTTGQTNVFYAIYDDPNNPNKLNIYVWNGTTQSYVWVGDNTLYLGDYYTKDEGEQFESDIDNRVTSVENELSSVAQGSPKGVYATVEDLQTAYPTGTTGIFVISSTGHWYYWNGSAWTDGGAYLSDLPDNELSLASTNSLQNKVITDALTKTQNIKFVDRTSQVNGNYITLYGDLGTSAPYYARLDGIVLKKGETICVKAAYPDYSVICAIAIYDSSTTVIGQPQALGTSADFTEYKYTATRDCVVSVTLTSDTSLSVCYICENVNTNSEDIANGNIGENSLSPLKLNNDFEPIYENSENVLDNSKIFDARLVDANGKLNYIESGDKTSDFIYCYGKQTVYIWSAIAVGVQALYIAFYNENKEFISISAWQVSANVPNGAYYVRVNFTNDIWTTYNPMITFRNDIPTEYIPYGRKIKSFVEDSLGNLMRMFKTIGIIGDSLSSGEVYTQNGTPKDVYANSWLSNLCVDTGSIPTFYSTGGLSTKGWLLSGYKTNFDNDQAKQLYIIALGTNDASQGEYPLGNITDVAGTDSFVGYYKQIIELIHSKNAYSKIMCVSIYGNGNTTYQTQYSDMIKQICSLYNYCYFIDFANNCPPEINMSISRIYTPWQENWHYTGLGYIAVGKTMLKLMNQIIYENLNEFKFFVADIN